MTMARTATLFVVCEHSAEFGCFLPVAAFPPRNHKLAYGLMARNPSRRLVVREMSAAEARKMLSDIDVRVMDCLEGWRRFFAEEIAE